MANVTYETAERIRQIVLDCSIRRLSAVETAEFLKQKGINIDVRTVKRYRARIKESAQQWIAKLAKSRRADYIAVFKERIDEVYKYQHKLWEMVDDGSGEVHARTKVEAIGKLLNCTSSLVELYDCMPVMAAIREYDNNTAAAGNDGNGVISKAGSCSRYCADSGLDEESRYRCDLHSQQYDGERHPFHEP